MAIHGPRSGVHMHWACRRDKLQLAGLLAVLFFCLSCQPNLASVKYDSPKNTLRDLPISECIDAGEQALVRRACAEQGSSLSNQVHKFADGRIHFAYFFCLLIAVGFGLLLGLTIKALGRRGKFGFPLMAGMLAVAYGLAGLSAIGLFRWIQMPNERGLVAADWVMRELKELERIPKTPDEAAAARTCNCVDRIQDIADGRVDDSAKPLREYYPFWFTAPPLPPVTDDIQLLNDSTYQNGMRLRASDLGRLLDAGDINHLQKSSNIVEILDSNTKLREALLARGAFVYYTAIYGWPAGVPIGAMAIIALILPCAALVFLRVRPN